MTKKTSADTKVKALPKSKRELTGKDMRKVKGGVTPIRGGFGKFGDIKGETSEDKHKEWNL